MLLDGTDPLLVKLELDVAWAVAGGMDPVALLAAHPDRFRLIHVKGLDVKPPLGAMAADFATSDLGPRNAIPGPDVFAAAHRAGVRHAFVEQEPPYRRPVMHLLAAACAFLHEV